MKTPFRFNLPGKILLDRFIKNDEADYICADLGAGCVKAVYRSGDHIEKFLAEKIKGNPVKTLCGWLEKEKIPSRRVKLAIKGQDTLIRYIPFPKVDKKNLKEVFSYEISKFIPFTRDEVYFDVFVLDENYSSTEMLIFLAVAKKGFLDAIIKSLEEAKLNIDSITLNNAALLNLYLNESSGKVNTAIIDVGQSSTLLNLVKKSTPCLSREIKISAADFLQRAAKIKNISPDEAQDMIINGGRKISVEEIHELIAVVEDIFLELCEEIKNSLDYFEVNWGQRIEEVYVTGGLSKIKGVSNIVVNSLGIETKIWDPLLGFKIETNGLLSDFKEGMAVVLGLAL